MNTILITGSSGFIGKNLAEALKRLKDIRVTGFDVQDSLAMLEERVLAADVIFHLAGVNRPKDPAEFVSGNSILTERICDLLASHGKATSVVFASSTQADKDNPYGKSKACAEASLLAYAEKTNAPVYLYRLTNVFGKWSRPNYNSVVSTFCHNIARNLEITISNPANSVELVYIDDVVTEFVSIVNGSLPPQSRTLSIGPIYRVTLGELAEKIRSFGRIRGTLIVPDLSDEFTRKLHSTYLSYLEPDDFSYPLDLKTDNRGELAELFKSLQFGQIFVSRTRPGITRGNHYHDLKNEKFCVLQGEAIIRFRNILDGKVIEYPVSGRKWTIVDIPPGYTHSIENIGDSDMVTLFWSNTILDPSNPDTYFSEVKNG